MWQPITDRPLASARTRKGSTAWRHFLSYFLDLFQFVILLIIKKMKVEVLTLKSVRSTSDTNLVSRLFPKARERTLGTRLENKTRSPPASHLFKGRSNRLLSKAKALSTQLYNGLFWSITITLWAKRGERVILHEGETKGKRKKRQHAVDCCGSSSLLRPHRELKQRRRRRQRERQKKQ